MFNFSFDEDDDKDNDLYNSDYDNYSLNRNNQIIYIEGSNSILSNYILNKDKEDIMETEKEKKLNDNILNGIKILESIDISNKSTTKNTDIKIITNEPENNLLGNKRMRPNNPNDKANENDLNKKEDIQPKFKVKKQKEKKENNSSLAPDIAKFHNLFNIYFKYLVEKESVDVSVFEEKDKKEGSNGLYISKYFTQSELGVNLHSLKLKKKISYFIQKNKLEKLKKKNDERILKILDSSARDLICDFFEYIFDNSQYFENNKDIKKINDNFIRIRKYPFIDFKYKNDKTYKSGYFLNYD